MASMAYYKANPSLTQKQEDQSLHPMQWKLLIVSRAVAELINCKLCLVREMAR